MKIRPTQDMILIRFLEDLSALKSDVLEVIEQKDGQNMMVDTAFAKGEVVDVGTGYWNKKKKCRVPLDVKPEDLVVYILAKQHNLPVKYGEETLYLVRETNVVGLLD